MVQGQPGPNMRAAAFQAQQQHQQPKAQGPSSIIMPIYTFGIVAFFVFTIVKIVMKKTTKPKVKPLEPDPKFVEKVFKQAQPDPKKKLGESRTAGRFRFADAFGIIKQTKFSFLIFQREIFEMHSGWKDHNASKNSRVFHEFPLNFPKCTSRLLVRKSEKSF